MAFFTPRAAGTAGFADRGSRGGRVDRTWLLARFLGGRSGWALLYGACPAVALEAANGAHLDAISALCVFGLGWAAVRRRHWLAGVFLGLAGGLKLVPLLLAPSLPAGWPLADDSDRVGFGDGVVPAASGGGRRLWCWASCPAHWREEGSTGARRFALLSWLPELWRMPVALALAACLRCSWPSVRSSREPVLVTCCWLYGCPS